IGFTVLLGCTSIVLFGLWPALRATRRDVHDALKAGARGSRRGGFLGRGFVAAQLALALVLVSSASLLVATLRNLTSQDIGVRVAHLSAVGVETRGTSFESSGIVPLHAGLLRAAQSAPGVAG